MRMTEDELKEMEEQEGIQRERRKKKKLKNTNKNVISLVYFYPALYLSS